MHIMQIIITGKKLQGQNRRSSRKQNRQSGAHKEGVYYLKNRNGYVIVYLDDQTSIYEYTNIRVEELPEELQNEIREGKRLEGKDKLYGFLENYSS